MIGDLDDPPFLQGGDLVRRETKEPHEHLVVVFT
jgi:hypothetical protein